MFTNVRPVFSNKTRHGGWTFTCRITSQHCHVSMHWRMAH